VLAIAVFTGTAVAAPLVMAYDDDGMVTVNGKRTFIIGSYYHSSKYDENLTAEQTLAELEGAGFNLVRAGNVEEMDKAHAAGLMTWNTVGTIKMDDKEASSAQLIERVNAIKDHPSLAILESVDEPAWTHMKAEWRVPPEPFLEAYPLIKKAAPNQLLYMNHAPTNLVKTMRLYNGGTDIVAMDIYPVNPGGLKPAYALFEDGYQGDLNNIYISQVGEYVDKMRRVTGPDRPLLMVLQGFAWEMLRKEEERDESKILYPLYPETRFMAFQSIIKGANGIVYWGTHYTPRDSDCWIDLKRVVKEVADLAGPLAERAADVAIEADYHEMGRSVDDGVQILAKLYNGKLYVFTCNADKNPCKATLSGFGGWKTCAVLNEDRQALPLADGTVTDGWKPFDVHVYVFEK
jgi:hypothetical protein